MVCFSSCWVFTLLNFSWYNVGALFMDQTRNTVPAKAKMIPSIVVWDSQNLYPIWPPHAYLSHIWEYPPRSSNPELAVNRSYKLPWLLTLESGVSPLVAWGDFHARSRFAPSTILRKNKGVLVVMSSVSLFRGTYIAGMTSCACVIGLFWAVLRACLHGGGGPQVGEVTCGGSLHLSCKRDQIKIRDYYGQVCPPPPWKQALSPFSKTRINTKSLIRKWFPNSNSFEFEQNSFWYENFGFWVSEMDYPLLLENIERWLCTIYSGGGGGGKGFGFGLNFFIWLYFLI